jgi:hypothetical protein
LGTVVVGVKKREVRKKSNRWGGGKEGKKLRGKGSRYNRELNGSLAFYTQVWGAGRII